MLHEVLGSVVHEREGTGVVRLCEFVLVREPIG